MVRDRRRRARLRDGRGGAACRERLRGGVQLAAAVALREEFERSVVDGRRGRWRIEDDVVLVHAWGWSVRGCGPDAEALGVSAGCGLGAMLGRTQEGWRWF